MEVRPGYKQTEVGVIPEQWDAKPLHSVLSKGRLGGNYPNQETESEWPLIKMGNIARGYFDMSKVEFIVPEANPESQHHLAYGDVLFNTRNTLDLVGKVAIWRNELPVAYYNSNLMRLEFDANEICSNEFANYALNTTSSVARLRALATGTTSVSAIYTRDLMGLQFVVPPKPEQRVIATVLSDVDALLGGLARLIAKKRDLKQAAMQRLLTGKTRLAGFSGEWETKRLSEIASIRNQKVLPSIVGIDTPCIELDHIGQGNGRLLGCSTAQDSKSPKYRFFSGDVLFGRLRSYLRKYWHADRDGICTTEIWPLMTDSQQADSGFLHAIVQSDRFIEAASISYGTHMPRTDWGVMRNFEVRLPRAREQLAIAEVLADMDAELAALEARRDKTRDLKQAMMQELLTGKTRLVAVGGTHS